MKNVNPLRALNQLLSILCVGAIFFIASCGSDDEPAPDPTTIQFSAATATIDENATEALTLTVSLSEASNIAGSFTIAISSTDATYGDDYTTNPDGTSGSINMTVAEGDQNFTLSISAVDNDDFAGDKAVTFTLTSVEGVELNGNATLTVTIADNEMMPTEIGTLRTQFETSGEATIEGPAVIEGVVTSSRDNTTGQNLFIQDATGGIVLRFTETNTDFDMGESLRVDIAGGLLSEFGGLVQINNLELTAATERGMGTLPDPVDVTITELLTGDHQGLIVRLSDVAIDGADGTATFGGGLDIIDVSGNEVGSFVRNDAAFNGDVIPVGTGTVTGIASSFSDTPQIDLRTGGDVSFTEAASITVDASNITDFGSVMTGMTSDVQTYTVTGADLLADIELSAPNNFEISLNGTDFAAAQTIASADAGAGVTVSVRFAPNENVSGTSNGDISHKSFGAASKDVAVTGTESAPTVTIAFTSFQEPSTGGQYTDVNGAGDTDHDLINNEGEAAVDFTAADGEMGFDATYVAVATVNGSLNGLTDGDFVGVSNFTGDFPDDVGYTDGDQGYAMEDTDGKMVLTFDAVDVSAYTTASLKLDLFVNGTGWETSDDEAVSSDIIRVYVITDTQEEVDLLNTNGMDIDDNFAEYEEVWTTLTTDLSSYNSATLVVELTCDSGSESINLDNVIFTGQN